MRTKTLFIAAAALAAGLVTSMAQNVYSVNIVGYVNITNPPGIFTMLANPLDNGTNDLYSLLPAAPNGTVVGYFNGAGVSTTTKLKGAWGTDIIVPPGNGFMVKMAVIQTNTFIGSSPTSNSVVLASGVSVMAGSPIPFSGTLTDSGVNTLNLGPSLANGSTVTIMDGGVLLGSTKLKGNWGQNWPIAVGQGFYVKPNGAATWTQQIQ